MITECVPAAHGHGHSRDSVMHDVRVRRRLLQLLDRGTLLPRPQRHLQARAADAEPGLRERHWWYDCVLHAVLQPAEGYCLPAST